MLAVSNQISRERSEASEWVDVCSLDDIVVGTGVAALVQGHQVAIFRPQPEQLFALSNFDPFSRAFVMSRGIVGDKQGVLKVASPIYKQNFELATGQCLDEPKVRLPSYPVSIERGRVLVSVASAGVAAGLEQSA